MLAEANKEVDGKREFEWRSRIKTAMYEIIEKSETVLIPFVRALLLNVNGSWIDDHFSFDVETDFGKCTDQEVVKEFNLGFANEFINQPKENIEEMCGWLGIDYKEIRAKVSEEFPHKTKEEIKQQLAHNEGVEEVEEETN